MSDLATYPVGARNAYASPYPFEPSNGALGILMSATSSSGTSSRMALVGAGHTLIISSTNGSVDAHLALGDSSVVATTSHAVIHPGETLSWTLPAEREGSISPTHAAVITISGTVNIQITRGYGV